MKKAARLAVSPHSSRRWRLFRSDRVAFASLWVLGLAGLVSLGAELLCNSRPLVVSYQGSLYFPMVKSYPETTFGGDFETETNFTDPLIQEVLAQEPNWAIFPPVRFSYDDVDSGLSVPTPSPPDRVHPLGTDDRGRDVFARLIYGFRLSLCVGLMIALVSSVVGVMLGVVQGYLGGLWDLLGQRAIEIWSSLPELYLLIILATVLPSSVTLIVLLLSLFGWMGVAAYVRADTLRIRSLDFVTAATAMGAGRLRVMIDHVIPNAMTSLITFFPFRVSGAITGLTALDFLGLGVPSPTPSLGELLAQGKAHLQSWWIMGVTFTVLVGTITALNFLGDGLRRAMDPRGQ